MSETKNNTTNSTDRPVEQTKQTEKKPDKTEHDEEGNANAEDLYNVLVKVQNRWEDVITAQDET